MSLSACLSAIILAFCCVVSAHGADRPALERGTAIIDPLALRELDHGPLGLTQIMQPVKSADTPLTNAQLFALPSMAPVKKALDDDFERYVAKHKAEMPNESIGVGNEYAFQLFDRAQLTSPDTRFVLSGIVNRMDRGYVPGLDCGEIRLIYRLTPTNVSAPIGEASVSPRLPMTLNVVLKAKGEGVTVSCADIAKRWLAAGSSTATGAELAEKLTAPGEPLDLIAPENIDRIETNLQIAHAPKSPTRDFRTDYLMKVFDYDARSRAFVESALEDQVDRDRLLTDASLARDLKAWLLDPVHLAELDRGTVLIPDRFLLKAAIAPTPTGFSPSELQPAFGLVEGEDGTHKPIFAKSDVVLALAKAAALDVKLQNIRSVGGFERRLNDVSCSGCHQTRGIGGFHFPGVDWMAAKPSNSTVVPASPHFFGDQVRRRDIVTAFAEGKQPDFSRAFASRPQLRGSPELAGTEYEDGWGAHCYAQHTNARDNDQSFVSWTCAEGLTCQTAGDTARMGMCFVKTR
ncbi:MAG: hypothetical protein JO141_00985 [Bradyrhizobium sp.]|nr:hypothetical protein [Bradyrhizobium sp.]